ncbi:hypothetical protein K2173_003384 [Erythroxylum novogranatense]|uniref:Two-component response regulator-like APRR5 n=1 Tax=Erythroxylum novogranatense TaxID=1862640 RepID=A0AAV8S8P5_9ROSI|nr:hypothetical protein K2173_003384 [Erythroxylum novogranatense]
MAVIDDMRMEVEEATDNKGAAMEVVRWEKFLPNMTLRVLLVEADDSTRQIIAALLRKCSYKVAAFPDGLMAWEALKGRPHNLDLILTEVELPSISGYALLTLVMEHDFCRNIPVIMMSSHDSISMVLKCMLKGAADFLIKPVRRNELKNLWQHVWRRQTLPPGRILLNSSTVHHKIEATSETNATSDHSSDCLTSTQKNRDGREKGSDAQDLSRLKWNNASNLSNTGRDMYEEQATLEIESADSECKNRSNQSELACNETYNSSTLRLGEVNGFTRVRPESDKNYAINYQCNNYELVEPSSGTVDLISTFGNGSNRIHEHSSMDVSTNRFEFTPQQEIYLGRFCPTSANDLPIDEKQALNHSNTSAFSWYNSKTLRPFFPISIANGSGFEKDASNSPEISSNQVSQNGSGISGQHGSTGNSSQKIMTTLVTGSGQTDISYPSPQHGLIPVQGVKLGNISIGYDHVFPSSYYNKQLGLPPTWTPKVDTESDQSPFPSNTSILYNQDIDDTKHQQRQSDDTPNNSVDQNINQQSIEPVEELKHGLPTTGQSACSSLCNGVTNYDSSGHDSVCNGNDANATVSVATERAIESESLDDGLFIQEGLKGMDDYRSGQREAALSKFRLKRKNRCYEKKVRYQSRKKLAEQRPRVKGQFVRQVQNNGPAADVRA